MKLTPNKMYTVDLSDYHAELDKKHEAICKKNNITFERLVELNAIKMKNSTAWAGWQLDRPTMTKLDHKTACLIMESC